MGFKLEADRRIQHENLNCDLTHNQQVIDHRCLEGRYGTRSGTRSFDDITKSPTAWFWTDYLNYLFYAVDMVANNNPEQAMRKRKACQQATFWFSASATTGTVCSNWFSVLGLLGRISHPRHLSSVAENNHWKICQYAYLTLHTYVL